MGTASLSSALELYGGPIRLLDAARLLSGEIQSISISADSRRRIELARQMLMEKLDRGETIYGVNTGFGKLASQRIAASDILSLQENLLRSHAVGMGSLMPVPVARLALALRIAVLARGHSGVTPGLVDALVALFNAGIIPAIPELGSVGASGDLAPLAHLALVVIGEGQAFVTARGGQLVPGGEALRLANLQPYRLKAKEGLSLINGTQICTAILADGLVRSQKLARIADIAAAMTLEATQSSIKPFDPRIQAIRPHPGQAACAAHIRQLLEGSEIIPSHADCAKVQDAYSIRCVPQVHGTLRDGLDHVAKVVESEVNSVTDNPLVFPDTGEVLSGGNFHAQPVALAADLLAAAVTDLASISERRIENLVNPDLSGLPGFLTPEPGLNSGMMIVQVLAAALVSECKSLAHPASVDSIPTSANREDHVSMAPAAARKARAIVGHATRVLAAELLCAAQGLEFRRNLRPGRGVEAAYREIRKEVAPLTRDRTLHYDLEAIERLIDDGRLLRAVEEQRNA